MKHCIVILLLSIFSIVCLGQDGMNTGIIYGANHAYSLTAPKGWVLDNSSGVSQGLFAVFYKKGETWQEAPTIMYTNTASLENEHHKTIKQLIDYDIATYKNDEPSIQIKTEADISIRENLSASIRYFFGKNYESVAYIDAGKTGVLIIMSSRTKEGFDESINSFIDLVKSYLFISNKVVIQENK
jgi:hypothetical protein